MTEPNRERAMRKLVSFSPAEWDRISRRMEAAGAGSFDAFARDVLLEARVKVIRMPIDPASVRAELSRLGNNLNQVARQVNMEHGTTVDEMRAARRIMGEVQEVLNNEVKRMDR